MKRILLSCCLIAATFTATFAQSAATAPLTKAAFTAKANQLDNFIAHNNADAESATYADINKMMMQQLGAAKMVIANATSDADKATALTAMRHDRELYGQILNLSHDMTANRVALHAKLGEFATTIAN